jgi:cell division protease FtsH
LPEQNQDQETENKPRWGLVVALVLAVVAPLLLLGREWGRPGSGPEIPYSKFRSLVQEGQVAEVVVRGHSVQGELAEARSLGGEGTKTTSFQTRIPEFGKSDILDTLEEREVSIEVREPREGQSWAWALWLLPIVLLIGFYAFAMRRMARGFGGPGGLANLGQTRAKRVKPEASKVRFDDVAGQEGAKRDVVELVEFLRDPKRYEQLGAEVPHGILLAGPPGTGKTLVARALAGEAGVPFFHVSGSEFIEMVVGVGAARVRQTFQQAKQHQPSIIFIDEIDAIGRQRGTGMGGGHDEREQTLNQILDEMDGFGGRESVIVVAATNRPDVLDPALLRPGRFDRRLTLESPDKQARKQILELHTRDMPLGDDVDLDQVASLTPGFSGAHLKNLANEAGMLAGRDHCTKVTRKYFDEARDKVMLGPARPLAIGSAERRRLAIHESGHTAVAHYLDKTEPPYKVTIVPRGQALGGTHQLPDSEPYTMDEEYLRERLAVLLAGRASERTFLGTVSSGADDDIQKATQIARAMVSRWGMSDEVGPMDVRDSDDSPFLGYEIQRGRSLSDRTAATVDGAVRGYLLDAEQRAIDVLTTHRKAVEKLIESLESEETLTMEAIQNHLGSGEPSTPPSRDAEVHAYSDKH